MWNDHTLACRQSTGFDYGGVGQLAQIAHRLVEIAEGGRFAGGDFVAQQKFFAECLGAFQLCCGFGWPKDAQACRLKEIDNACHKRCFGTNDGEIDGVVFCKLAERGQIGGCDVDIAAVGQAGDACIAGRDINLVYLFGLSQLPGDCMFASAGAD